MVAMEIFFWSPWKPMLPGLVLNNRIITLDSDLIKIHHKALFILEHAKIYHNNGSLL